VSSCDSRAGARVTPTSDRIEVYVGNKGGFFIKACRDSSSTTATPLYPAQVCAPPGCWRHNCMSTESIVGSFTCGASSSTMPFAKSLLAPTPTTRYAVAPGLFLLVAQPFILCQGGRSARGIPSAATSRRMAACPVSGIALIWRPNRPDSSA
jgi:hypothetical protein